ncbi:MAG: SDR family NAD(P)-dependent oxidoreductase [Acidobacteriota bacterium]|nr:SDR family NAD(P)-dependent oxidoreductase [Acidobacteriota bacterium]
MKILVTGASGLVGGSIVKELLRNNFEVYALGGANSKTDKFGEVKNFFKADITEYQSLAHVANLEDVDVIIHSAGLAHQFRNRTEEEFWKVNVLGTENVARLAAVLKVKHFILISSVAVYGIKPTNLGNNNIGTYKFGITEEAVCQPQGFYARSKLESEKATQNICADNKIALTILRLTTVIGEEDKGNVARLIKAIDKRRFFWIGAGENFKSLIYKEDAAKACLKILRKTAGMEIFNVTAEPSTMKEIVSEIENNLGIRPAKFSIPSKILSKFFLINTKFLRLKKLNQIEGILDKWLSDDVFSGEKFKKIYDFQAETSIKEAIRRQVVQFKKNKKNKKTKQ